MCHGFWFIGAAYGFLFVVGIAMSRRTDLRTLVRLTCVPIGRALLVVLLNPAGLGVFEAPFRVNAVAGYITEWQRTQPAAPGPAGALLMIALTAVLWGVTRTGVSWTRVLMLSSAVFWVWDAERLVVVGAVVTVPLLAGALDGLLARSTVEQRGAEPRGADRRELLIVTAVGVAVLGVLERSFR